MKKREAEEAKERERETKARKRRRTERGIVKRGSEAKEKLVLLCTPWKLNYLLVPAFFKKKYFFKYIYTLLKI